MPQTQRLPEGLEQFFTTILGSVLSYSDALPSASHRFQRPNTDNVPLPLASSKRYHDLFVHARDERENGSAKVLLPDAEKKR